MASNPRIEDLRKRIEKDPGSRLFAQLAEELRKDGELEDAIRVARDGLKTHPNYPSARMTLGRALLDTGDWAAARTEFELVLKGAADNILASRYLGECLENLGEREAAIARYRSTLAMAPGEKHVLARLQELEGGAGSAAQPIAPATARPASGPRPASAAPGLRPASPAPMPASAPSQPAAPSAAEPPPIPLASVEGEMELETSRSPAEPPSAPVPAAALPMAPIPLVDADEEFELERPYESPTTGIGVGGSDDPAIAPVAPTPAPSTPAPAAPESVEEEFELEAPHEAPATGWAATIRPLPPLEEEVRAPPPPPAPSPPPAEAPAPPAAAPPPEAATSAPAATASSALISPTLGELYFNQGFTDKAIEVYRELSAREPANERLGARLRELQKLQGALAGSGPEGAPVPSDDETGAPPSGGGDPAERREAIERTIVRLEGLLSAIRKG